MAQAAALTWRRRFPRRALWRLGWYLFAAATVAAGTVLLFGAEPRRLPDGAPNPLALAPPVAITLLAAGLLPLTAALLRRPRLRADHYALQVRPGSLRTLLLPWSAVAELAATAGPGDEPVLLVRRLPGAAGDIPRWCDQAVLRTLNAGVRGRYQLALRVDDFTGEPDQRLRELAAWAPQRIRLTGFPG
ncbi:hypothetical protein JQS43_01360 [Natronosporangium hydrolyticum]|uniref:PH domain-containing protein n=1 Tax=Natronosporangium hydrolyticum TaxID=2811111 RepID=A0A895YHR1_9ACTN|nr:hypothetical protein [Natronosporangium hydrolyticum]QSB15059.1 hypothetical protein JQS43_01360 [Natronosporangium hydrolyticum]